MITSGVSRERACMRGLHHLEECGPRGGELLWDVIYELLKGGHGLAICTFSAFPELPTALLHRGVKALRARGAGREHTSWLSRPIVVYGDPNPRLRPKLITKGAYLVQVGPGQMSWMGKEQHIEQALEVANERLNRSLSSDGGKGVLPVCPTPYGDPSEPFERVLLVDDDPRNIEIAQKAGHLTTLAPPPEEDERAHLERLLAYFKEGSPL